MPRQSRITSYSGYSHVIVRGIGKQILFEEKEDYYFYLSRMKKYSQELNVTICAYCLMSNHVHLLTYDSEQNLSGMMKKLGVSYSWYFNQKYERTGHLFQDRFLSEPVENEAYLLSVFRYILNNPVKAGIGRAEDYPWSSYREYGNENAFTQPGIIAEKIGDQAHFAAFIRQDDDAPVMEYEKPRHDDQWADRIIRENLEGKSGTVLQQMDTESRNRILMKLIRSGVTTRQLERLTGINRGTIQRLRDKEK